MTEIIILGVGLHPFGRFGDKSYVEMGQQAARLALGDAGINWKEIQAAYMSRVYLPAFSGARILKPLGATGIPICDVEAACASGGVALRQAVLGIQSGEYDLVMVIGAEKMPRGFMDPSISYERWQIEMGLDINPVYWALRARRHMHDYGTTELQIAKVAYKNHRNSVHNPYAMYQKPFTLEQILGSTLVCDPIRLYEMCAPNEGAAAIILASADKARQYTSRPIHVAAAAHSLALYSADLRLPVEAMSARLNNPGPTERTAQQAYTRAGIPPQEIDCFEVQDTDAFCEIEIYEDLGLCQRGEGGRLIDEGVTEIDGRMPVNMSGGLISKGEPIGASHLGQVVELVWQLRGQAGERQVSHARTGLAHVLGGGGNCAITILKN
jgi:acetyl-CoA acetyltransferase